MGDTRFFQGIGSVRYRRQMAAVSLRGVLEIMPRYRVPVMPLSGIRGDRVRSIPMGYSSVTALYVTESSSWASSALSFRITVLDISCGRRSSRYQAYEECQASDFDREDRIEKCREAGADKILEEWNRQYLEWNK